MYLNEDIFLYMKEFRFDKFSPALGDASHMIELLDWITIFWYQILLDHNGHIHSLSGQTNHIILPSSQTPTHWVLWQSDSPVYVHCTNTIKRQLFTDGSILVKPEGWMKYLTPPLLTWNSYQVAGKQPNISALLMLMHCVLESECHFTACVFIPSPTREESPFWGIIGFQFFQTEMKPGRRVGANLKRFLAQSP